MTDLLTAPSGQSGSAEKRRRGRPGHEKRRLSPGKGGIVGGLLMSFFLLCVLLVAGSIFFVHTIKVHESGGGNDVQVETPFGSVHVATTRAASPKLPACPCILGPNR